MVRPLAHRSKGQVFNSQPRACISVTISNLNPDWSACRYISLLLMSLSLSLPSFLPRYLKSMQKWYKLGWKLKKKSWQCITRYLYFQVGFRSWNRASDLFACVFRLTFFSDIGSQNHLGGFKCKTQHIICILHCILISRNKVSFSPHLYLLCPLPPTPTPLSLWLPPQSDLCLWIY